MKRLNWECFTQIAVLVLLDVLLFTALATGRMKYYIHPRLEKYVWFAGAALLIIAVSMLPRLFRPKHKVNIFSCIVLLIPLMTGFIIPASTGGSANMQLGGSLSVVSGSADFGTGSNGQEPLQTAGQTAGNVQFQQPVTSQDIVESDAAGTFNSDSDFITVSDEDYLAWYADAYANPEKYDGKTVKIKGTVFRMKDFSKDEFVTARMSMVCCAADLSPYGFLCKSSSAADWKDNDWVYVTAKIKVEYEKYMKMTLPVLYAVEITKAEKPEDEFIYPY